jgi:hypothetical protein
MLGLLCPHLADHPRLVGGLSALRCVLREFLHRFLSIRRVGRFQLEEVGRTVRLGRPDCSRSSDRPRCSPGPSEFEGSILEAQGHLADCPPLTHGLSARSTRTIRRITSDRPPRASQISYVLCFWSCSFAWGLFESCSYGW